MPSPPPAFPFAPTRETLERVLAYDDDAAPRSWMPATGAPRSSGTRVSRPDARRAPGREPSPGLRWSSGRMTLATTPVAPVAADDPEIDRPALATENAGGLVHLGATRLHGPPGRERRPARRVCSLAEARRTHPSAELRAAMRDGARTREAIASRRLRPAFANCGAFVHVPAGTRLDAPIQLVWAYPEPRTDAVFPLIVVVLEAGAQATVIERHVGDGEPYVSALVRCERRAKCALDYVAIQHVGDGGRMHARSQRASRSGRPRVRSPSRNSAECTCAASSTFASTPKPRRQRTGALFFNTGRAVRRPRDGDGSPCAEYALEDATYERPRPIADAGGSSAAFACVRAPRKRRRPARRRTAALARRAHRNDAGTRIQANDVRAFHAATVGSLDAEALFYIQAAAFRARRRSADHARLLRTRDRALSERVDSR